MAEAETTADSAIARARIARAEGRFDDARTLLESTRSSIQMLGGVASAVTLELGEVLMDCGEVAAAADLFESVAREAERLDQPELLARAALGFAAGLSGFEVRLDDERQAMLLEQADRALDGDISALAAYVKARLSVALSFIEESERRRGMADVAVAIAEQAGDRGAIGHALAARCDAIAGPDHIDERLVLADRIIDLGRQARQPELALLGRRFQIVALLERGDLVEVDRSIAAFRRETSRYGSDAIRWYVPLWHGMRAAMRGDVTLALEQAAEAESIGRQAGSGNAEMLVATLRFGLGMLTGDLDADLMATARSICNAEVARTNRTSARVVLLGLALVEGNHDDARRHLGLVAAAEFGERDSEWLGTVAVCADAAIELGDDELQRRIRDALEPYDGRLVVDGIAAGVLGSVREYLGTLDFHLDGDRTRLEKAIAEYQQMGAPLLARRAKARLSNDEVTSAGSAAPVGSTAVREGEVWAFSYGGSVCRVRDGKGVQDIVRLLERPDVEIHVAELAGPTTTSPSAPIVVLDAAAKRAYRERVASLQEDIDDADAAYDTERASRARVELDFLLDELRKATGLGGRERTAGTDHERARQAVRARIRHATGRIAEHHPVLGRHLERSIRTGTFCSYAPDPPVAWTISR